MPPLRPELGAKEEGLSSSAVPSLQVSLLAASEGQAMIENSIQARMQKLSGDLQELTVKTHERAAAIEVRLDRAEERLDRADECLDLVVGQLADLLIFRARELGWSQKKLADVIASIPRPKAGKP